MSVLPTPVLRQADHDKNMYRGLAMSQMRILSEQMKLGGLNTGSRILKMDNGVEILCKKCFNLEEIFITIPATPATIAKIVTGVIHGFVGVKLPHIGRYGNFETHYYYELFPYRRFYDEGMIYFDNGDPKVGFFEYDEYRSSASTSTYIVSQFKVNDVFDYEKIKHFPLGPVVEGDVYSVKVGIYVYDNSGEGGAGWFAFSDDALTASYTVLDTDTSVSAVSAKLAAAINSLGSPFDARANFATRILFKGITDSPADIPVKYNFGNITWIAPQSFSTSEYTDEIVLSWRGSEAGRYEGVSWDLTEEVPLNKVYADGTVYAVAPNHFWGYLDSPYDGSQSSSKILGACLTKSVQGVTWLVLALYNHFDGNVQSDVPVDVYVPSGNSGKYVQFYGMPLSPDDVHPSASRAPSNGPWYIFDGCIEETSSYWQPTPVLFSEDGTSFAMNTGGIEGSGGYDVASGYTVGQILIDVTDVTKYIKGESVLGCSLIATHSVAPLFDTEQITKVIENTLVPEVVTWYDYLGWAFTLTLCTGKLTTGVETTTTNKVIAVDYKGNTLQTLTAVVTKTAQREDTISYESLSVGYPKRIVNEVVDYSEKIHFSLNGVAITGDYTSTTAVNTTTNTVGTLSANFSSGSYDGVEDRLECVTCDLRSEMFVFEQKKATRQLESFQQGNGIVAQVPVTGELRKVFCYSHQHQTTDVLHEASTTDSLLEDIEVYHVKANVMLNTGSYLSLQGVQPLSRVSDYTNGGSSVSLFSRTKINGVYQPLVDATSYSFPRSDSVQASLISNPFTCITTGRGLKKTICNYYTSVLMRWSATESKKRYGDISGEVEMPSSNVIDPYSAKDLTKYSYQYLSLL